MSSGVRVSMYCHIALNISRFFQDNVLQSATMVAKVTFYTHEYFGRAFSKDILSIIIIISSSSSSSSIIIIITIIIIIIINCK